MYTIGHSAHTAEHFAALLRGHAVEVLVDTRSSPYSKFAPQFDRESLRGVAAAARVRYLYLGDVVGGRPEEEGHYDERGRVRYGVVAAGEPFLQAVARLERGAERFRIALLCAEEDPARCHRRLLVGKVLIERGVTLRHIRGDGAVDDEAAIERKSGKLLFAPQVSLFEEMDEERWRSSASVLRKGAPRRSSGR